MAEIHERHAIDVNKNPHLDRCRCDLVFCNNTGTGTGSRIFAIGASHVVRLIGGLAECGIEVVNLAKPGWLLSDGSASEIRSKLRNMNITAADILLIDPLSNSVFCGTDPDGNHIDPQKIDGEWHISGDLNVRSKSYLKNVLGHLKKITDSAQDCKIVMLAPVPRYLHAKCCADPDHVKNFGERAFQEELSEDLEKVGDLLTAWLEATDTPSLLVDYRAGADQPAMPVPDLTVDDQSIWHAADPVHPTPALYAKLSESIFSSLDELDASRGAAPKRARLESVVVRKASSDVRNNPSKQSWSVGVLPAPSAQPANSRGRLSSMRGRGGGRGGRRGRPWRGGRARAYFWAPRGAY
jgi:hypothetical protein